MSPSYPNRWHYRVGTTLFDKLNFPLKLKLHVFEHWKKITQYLEIENGRWNTWRPHFNQLSFINALSNLIPDAPL